MNKHAQHKLQSLNTDEMKLAWEINGEEEETNSRAKLNMKMQYSKANVYIKEKWFTRAKQKNVK